jgi:hypothetical protein
MPFTPEISLPTLRNLYQQYRTNIWTPYGFADAFNLKASWWGADVIGIDQGPIALMIENFRTGSLWSRYMTAPEIQRGLSAAGFTTVVSVPVEGQYIPLQWALEQNYPNPFNPNTTIRYSIAAQQITSLRVYDMLGREVAVLVDEMKEPGSYAVTWDAAGLSSGVYICRLIAGEFTDVKQMVIVK